jgi:AcrR family transcriptional regulator
LDVAAEVLTTDPTASLADVATAAGISRTTLHKRYPKRDDLLLAVGHDAVKRLAAGIAMAELPTSGTAELATRALRTLVTVLIPQGAQVNFLLRQPSLDADADLTAAIAALDDPVTDFVRHAQAVGVLNADLPPWWVISSLYALTYSAWDAVRTGHLAELYSSGLAFDTLLRGVGG